MPGLLRSDRGGLSVSSPSGERKDACSLPGRCRCCGGAEGAASAGGTAVKQEPHLHGAALCSPAATKDLPPECPDTTGGFTPQDSTHHRCGERRDCRGHTQDPSDALTALGLLPLPEPTFPPCTPGSRSTRGRCVELTPQRAAVDRPSPCTGSAQHLAVSAPGHAVAYPGGSQNIFICQLEAVPPPGQPMPVSWSDVCHLWKNYFDLYCVLLMKRAFRGCV
ncbi:uncharacterized protein LOC129636657 isoform X2 [Bubalus kerabau]|uniref:uncharacterized protein LOC129636657 isoform X2 n=1 Tax=Bubalus carabanensis TaxID=3119969 RepID=UPI00244EDB87|nr:uncharacterized protein LOC129636657 isoform X2 [Bubalus carabanensis]